MNNDMSQEDKKIKIDDQDDWETVQNCLDSSKKGIADLMDKITKIQEARKTTAASGGAGLMFSQDQAKKANEDNFKLIKDKVDVVSGNIDQLQELAKKYAPKKSGPANGPGKVVSGSESKQIGNETDD